MVLLLISLAHHTHPFVPVAAHALDIADGDGGPVEGRGILAEVQLAPTRSRKSFKFLLFFDK